MGALAMPMHCRGRRHIVDHHQGQWKRERARGFDRNSVLIYVAERLMKSTGFQYSPPSQPAFPLLDGVGVHRNHYLHRHQHHPRATMIDQQIKRAILQFAYLILFLYHKLIFIIPYVEYYFYYYFQYPRFTVRRNLRIPNHIALAFTDESNKLELNSITDLICWSKQLGIKYITLYDDLGKLKAKQKELYRFLDHKASLLDDNNSNENHFQYEPATTIQLKNISYIKGLTILSRLDGRQKFVSDIRDLLKVEPDKIDLDLVQMRVGWTCDPELLIIFGFQQCLHGFPPWQLRLTEILSIPSHRNVTYRMFIDCLEKYSRTTQRLGA
jgi:dehydrodolichyl diphosphate syntase complex subunit NUS1